MSGLILELQRDALNKEVEVSNLLRKALVISKKLNISELDLWISNELYGYTSDAKIPKYREVIGSVKVFNPYHGWQPVFFEDPKMGERLSKREVSQAIGTLEQLIKEDKSNTLQIPFGQAVKNIIMKQMDLPMEPTLVVATTQVHEILESVRNEVLNWALELESKGIKGEGMSFSKEEKQAVQTNYNITNHINKMENSQLLQNSSNSKQTLNINKSTDDLHMLLNELTNALSQLQLNDDDQAELKAEISTVSNQLSSPKPKSLIIKESLRSAKSILEGVTSSVLATGLVEKLSSFF